MFLSERATEEEDAAHRTSLGGAQYPADVLDLMPWKVELPVKAGDGVKTVSQPKLATFAQAGRFFLDQDGTGVVLRVHHGDPTTPNSKNPRCELREMTPDGRQMVTWAAKSGTHTLTVTGQVNRLTPDTKTVVLAQVHGVVDGKKDDVTVFRLKGRTLYVTDGNNSDAFTVTEDFALKSRYNLKIEIKEGRASYWYNGDKVPFTLTVDSPASYFKAGNYLQSNKTTAPHESKDEYSEVVLYSVTVSHSAHHG